MYKKAGNIYNHLIQQYPNHYEGFQGLVKIAQHQQDWNRVIELSIEFQTKFPNLWQSYWWIGQAYKTITQYALSEEQFNQLVVKFPNKHYGFEGLYQLMRLTDTLENAFVMYQESYNRKVPNEQNDLAFIRTLLNMGLINQAHDKATNLLTNNPKSISAYHGLALIKQDCYEYQSAYEYFQIAIKYCDENLVEQIPIILSARHTYDNLKLYFEYND